MCDMKTSEFSRQVRWLIIRLAWLAGPLVPTVTVAALPLQSAPVTLAWNAVNDPSVQGYAVYYGPTTHPDTNFVDASTRLSVTLFNLLADTSYWFYAVAYDAAGNESVPSNALIFTSPPPVCPRLGIARLATGEFRLALFAVPGSVFLFEYADQPGGGLWESLCLATADANGALAVTDLATPPPPSRFYRATWLANPPPFTRQYLAPPAKGNLRIKLNDAPDLTPGLQFAGPSGSPPEPASVPVTANTPGQAVAINLLPSPGTLNRYRPPLQ